MGIFSTYKVALANNVSVPTGNTDDPTIVLTASEKTLVVSDISVCNLSDDQDIRVNVKIRMTVGDADPKEVYRVKNAVVKASSSNKILLIDQTQPQVAGDFLNLIGIKNNTLSPDTTTELLIFTNSPTQVCDCMVNYVVLEETPWNPNLI